MRGPWYGRLSSGCASYPAARENTSWAGPVAAAGPAHPLGALLVRVLGLADVLRDELLERLELLEELVRGHSLLPLRGAKQPRCRLDRGLPGDLLNLGVLAPAGRGLSDRFDRVE